jgi:hypothetical protein
MWRAWNLFGQMIAPSFAKEKRYHGVHGVERRSRFVEEWRPASAGLSGIGRVAAGVRATARVVNASSSDGAVDQHVARSRSSDSP